MPTFIIEAVYSVDAGHFMIASEKEEVLRVLDLVGQQETDGLHGLLPSIHVVPQKQVVGVRGERPVFEQPKKVCVLTVDVSWSFKLHSVMISHFLSYKFKSLAK